MFDKYSDTFDTSSFVLKMIVNDLDILESDFSFIYYDL